MKQIYASEEALLPEHGESTVEHDDLSEGSLVPIDTAWFRGVISDRRTSARQLAFSMGLDPAAMSLMLRGMRKMSIVEAGELAALLGQPLEEVIRRAGGVSGPIRTPAQIAASGGARAGQGPAAPERAVKVVGWVDRKGVVHLERPSGPRTVDRPPGVPMGAQALRVQSRDLWDGWLLFYKPAKGVPAEAIGQMCVVERADGTQLLRFVNRGYEAGRWTVGGGMHPRQDGVALVSAAPVLWMKQR